MDEQLLDKLSDLKANRQPFVLATVVSCENPTSAKPGAKAIVLGNGTVLGWVGGSCAQPIVVQEAKQALQDGLPKLLKIGTEQAKDYGKNNGVRNFEMTCFSGGAMEIFIEPVLPKPYLLLFGNSPDLQALARLGQVMNFEIAVCDPGIRQETFPKEVKILTEPDPKRIKKTQKTYIVIATHGRYDEEALEKALAIPAEYIGLISSKKRARAIFDYLKSKGINEKELKRVSSPAGLDIGANSPDEIALSILAEIVALRRRVARVAAKEVDKPDTPSADEAVDPICGMTVDIKSAKFKIEYQDDWFYFCCAGCLQKFQQEPEKHIEQAC
ncbi:MAG: XdhC family protein [bacterium]